MNINKQKFSISIFLTYLFLSLSACGGIPIHASSDENLPSGTELRKLVGKSSDAVIESIGHLIIA